MSRPMVIQGAAPEALLAAVAHPHRLVSLSDQKAYREAEANLLVLCGLKLSTKLESRHCVVKIDISTIKIPQQLDIQPRELLLLARLAVEKTLELYYSGQAGTMKIDLRIVGIQNNDQLALREIERRYTIVGKVQSN